MGPYDFGVPQQNISFASPVSSNHPTVVPNLIVPLVVFIPLDVDDGFYLCNSEWPCRPGFLHSSTPRAVWFDQSEYLTFFLHTAGGIEEHLGIVDAGICVTYGCGLGVESMHVPPETVKGACRQAC